MPTRDIAPIGSPCWVDLWTSDVEGSRRFYRDLFGWEAQEPSAEFGGYFMFTHDGVPVAGGMGDMGDMRADNAWKIYLTTDDINKTVDAAQAEGGRGRRSYHGRRRPGHPGGADGPYRRPPRHLAAWDVPGLRRAQRARRSQLVRAAHPDHAAAVAFYRSVFRWDTNVVGDTDEFRYTVMRDPNGEGELAGIMDAASFLPRASPPTGRSTGGSMTFTPPSPRSRRWGARSCRIPRTPRTGAWPPSESGWRRVQTAHAEPVDAPPSVAAAGRRRRRHGPGVRAAVRLATGCPHGPVVGRGRCTVLCTWTAYPSRVDPADGGDSLPGALLRTLLARHENGFTSFRKVPHGVRSAAATC